MAVPRRSWRELISYWFFPRGAIQISIAVVACVVLAVTTVAWGAAVLAGLTVIGIGFVTAAGRYLWETRRTELDSVRESRRRAKRGCAAHRQSEEPVIGVYARGAPHPWWAGHYVWVTFAERNPSSRTALVVLRRMGIGIAVLDGPDYEDLPEFLDAHGIGILPLGSYADRIWERRFADWT